MPDLGEGPEGPQPPLFWKTLHKFNKKNTEMNGQVPFSGPFFPQLGSQPSLSKLSGSTPDCHKLMNCFSDD